jgi:O-antigen ligase
MNGRAQPLRRLASSDVTIVAAALVGALAIGALYPITATRASPWALPGVIILALVGVIAFHRPEIGIAFALVIIPLGTVGLDPRLATYLVQAWSAYLGVVSAWRWRARKDAGERRPLMAVLVVLYIVVALLSVTQTSSLHVASQLLRSLLTGALLFAATSSAVRGRREIVWILAGAAGGAMIVGLQAVREHLSGGAQTVGFITNTGEIVGRVTAGFSQPNQLGGFLVVLVPLAITGALLARRGRLLFAAAGVVAAYGVYVSFSRGALVGLALVPFVFLRGRRLLLVGPLVVLVVLVSAPSLVRERFATLTTSSGELSTRVDIWRAAANIWERHPFIGVGLGDFPTAYSELSIPGKAFLPATVFQPPPHAHNVFLQLLAEEGLLGLISFLAIIALGIRTTLRLRRKSDRQARLIGSGLLAALLAFLVHNQFDVTLEDPQTGLYIFVLFGLIAAAGMVFHTEERQQPAASAERLSLPGAPAPPGP